jgi:hypothetical protein
MSRETNQLRYISKQAGPAQGPAPAGAASAWYLFTLSFGKEAKIGYMTGFLFRAHQKIFGP